MKRIAALLTILALLLGAVPACGEAAGKVPDLFEIYEITENGKTWSGTAVNIKPGVAVTSPVMLTQGSTQAEIWDGTEFRPLTLAILTGEGTLLVILYETDGEDAAIPYYPFAEAGRNPTADELVVRSGDSMKSRINRAVYDAALMDWKGRESLILTLNGDTVPGAPVLTAEGTLFGIVIAEYAEGDHRYVALTIDEIYNCIQEANQLLTDAETVENGPEGYTVEMTGNLASFDWSAMKLPERAAGEKLYHVLADAESNFFTYTEITGNATRLNALLTPGRTYLSGMTVCTGVPTGLPEEVAVTILPEAEPMTDNHFRSEIMTIAEMPENAKEDTMPVPAEKITESLLRSSRACFYSVSSYEVTEKTENSTLLVALTAPDGNNYRYESGWYYDPSIQERDEWYVSLEETGLLEMLNGSGYPEGTYVLEMFIDGKLADSFSFELAK